MHVQAPLLRAVLGALNATGRMLQSKGIPCISLDARALITAAQRRTGLTDFGDEAFREPLQILLHAMETEAQLTLLGRITARRDMVSLLANRLRLQHDRKRYPAIADEQIRQPLFIVGLPRTGSTFLHHLLAQDPANRVAQAWEVMSPSPPPELQQYETDPRIASAAKQLRWFDRLAPDFKRIHPLGAQLPLECIAFLSYTFVSPRFHVMYHLPSYQAWLERQDFRPVYAFHQRFLQHLQWRTPAEQWVLKAPAHLFALPALFATYPDALVIQTHRDPLTVLTSVASLATNLQSVFTDHLDRPEIGRGVTRRWAETLDRAMQVRQDHRLSRAGFLDVHYTALSRDPMAVVQRIYAHCNRPLSEIAQTRMARFLAENAKDKHGAHQYAPETFGLDAAALAPIFKAYCEYFAVEPEWDALRR